MGTDMDHGRKLPGCGAGSGARFLALTLEAMREEMVRAGLEEWVVDNAVSCLEDPRLLEFAHGLGLAYGQKPQLQRAF